MSELVSHVGVCELFRQDMGGDGRHTGRHTHVGSHESADPGGHPRLVLLQSKANEQSSPSSLLEHLPRSTGAFLCMLPRNRSTLSPLLWHAGLSPKEKICQDSVYFCLSEFLTRFLYLCCIQRHMPSFGKETVKDWASVLPRSAAVVRHSRPSTLWLTRAPHSVHVRPDTCKLSVWHRSPGGSPKGLSVETAQNTDVCFLFTGRYLLEIYRDLHVKFISA